MLLCRGHFLPDRLITEDRFIRSAALALDQPDATPAEKVGTRDLPTRVILPPGTPACSRADHVSSSQDQGK